MIDEQAVSVSWSEIVEISSRVFLCKNQVIYLGLIFNLINYFILFINYFILFIHGKYLEITIETYLRGSFIRSAQAITSKIRTNVFAPS